MSHNITMDKVKELRHRMGGAGLLDCKKALESANGDVEAAVKLMREAGIKAAHKKSDRIAGEGIVVLEQSADQKCAVLVEGNCETDFVARNEDFIHYVREVAVCALSNATSDLEQLMALSAPGESAHTLEEKRQALIGRIGENVQIRRVALMQSPGCVASYQHGVRIGVLVDMPESSDGQLGRDIAMHIAASRPEVVSPEDVSEELIEKERAIYRIQAQSTDKPDSVIAKMVEGRVKKFFDEVCLLNQAFVKDPSQTVGALLASKQETVKQFVRFEVGEGIEKRSGDFVSEVMAQVKGSAQ